MQRLTSRHNPLVTRFRAVARGDEPELLLLDGEHLVREALRAGVRVRHAIVHANGSDRPEFSQLLSALEESGAAVALASTAVLDAVSPVRSPSGITALADRPSTPAAAVYQRARPLVVIAADVQDPGNVGAIVRVAEAGGAAGVVVAGATADPFGWKALRGSMGSALRLPVGARKTAADAIREARQHGCQIVATAPRGGTPLFECTFADAVAIVIGAEGRGLPADVLAAADRLITIPMQEPVESLNAAITAALVVYEVSRRRGRER
jgi:TrmH family RNA methyltransferase